MQFRIYFLCFLFLSQSISAQQSRQFTFTHFSTSNGLASNMVNNIVQDSKGFIWMATLDGLQRYDGNKFLNFRNRPGDPQTIPGDVIRKIMLDGKGNLWVWAGDKTGIFNTSNFIFSEKFIEGNKGNDPFHILLLDMNKAGDAMIYIHKQGLYCYQEKKDRFVETAHLPQLSDTFPFSAYYHEPGTSQIWFAGYNLLSMYDEGTKHLNHASNNPDRNPIIEKLSSWRSFINVYGQHGDEFWFATWDMTEPGAPFYKSLNVKTGEIKKFSPGLMFPIGYNEIVGMLHQQNGRIWFYGQPFIAGLTADSILFQIRNEYKDEQSIRFDKTFDMYEDRQHNLWLSTNNGVFVFNPDAETFVNSNMVRADGTGSIDGPAIAGLQLKDRRLLIGSWGSGIYFYDENLNPLHLPASLNEFRGSHAIWSLVQHSKNGKVWMGLQGGSLIVYDPNTGKSDFFSPELIAASTVRQILEDNDGNLWFGMQGGHIVKWDETLSGGDVRKGFIQLKSRENGFINKLFKDQKGFIWMASEADGLHKYDPRTNKELIHITNIGPQGKKVWSNTCNDIVQVNDSTLVIAGGALNVLNINTNNISYITTSDGLPSNTVYCMQRDDKGMIWLGMAQGISQFNFEKKLFTVYDRRDGIKYDNFIKAGAFKLLDGRLLFTTEHSFVVFDPSKLSTTTKPGNVSITNFRLSNKILPVDSLTQTGKALLKHNNTSIVIEFSSLNFMRQNKIHYFYKLEGIDKDWVAANESNQAVYSHLPSGDFTFRVKAENAEGVSSDFTELLIKVQPPFWKTWWFVGLIIFLIIGVIFWVDKLRTQKIRATESVRTRIATSLTEDLSNSLSSINISSELARTKVDADPKRTKEYITQISEASNRMIESVYDMVWSINPQNDTMQHTIDRMKIHSAEVENLYGMEIFFETDEDVKDIDLNMECRYEFLSIFKESIDNAGRHSKAKHAHVSIKYTKGKLVMLVEDDGKGFDVDEAAVKRGITDMRRRAAAINATFYIESEINTGTIVKVVMPV